ncbi:recombinase family protein [Aureibacter tunicatorum]|uniref:Resolvase/invertase-type recombinase catalytic domain-containing protein n=1 Tax=Aureibacter tunicatorum TaxID=866807 RepID=A0AAE4BUM9_9BACT|nr:recombinase family protein [Aureibacter tunicatorum]MDR6241931.1 hypothetical protein [Aureibacter tunicatorum]
MAYYRVSTDKQGKSGLGLESQRAIIEHYFENDEIILEFTETKSGSDLNKRTELQEAMKFCKDNGYTLVVAKSDRLTRDMTDAMHILGELDNRVHACDISQEKGKLDMFIFQISIAIAQKEREFISIRTKLALKAKKERLKKEQNIHEQSIPSDLATPNKFTLGNTQNFTNDGRRKGRESMIKKAKERERTAYFLAKAHRDNGYTLIAIAHKLNEAGLRTANNKLYGKSQVSRMFKRWNDSSCLT